MPSTTIRTRFDDNLKFPLWQLVRASTAAPTYFPPEVIMLSNPDKTKEKQFVFVDGGVTMYNNPAFQMFLMATLDRYWAKAPAKRWKAGVDQMLIVSVGTGTAPNVNSGLDPDDMNLLYNASTIPSALMFAAQNEQDLLCRVFGKCLAGDPIDREIGDLLGSAGPLRAGREAVHLCPLRCRADARGSRSARLPGGRTRDGAEARFGRRNPRPDDRSAPRWARRSSRSTSPHSPRA